jgi:glycosyltransferase involved in cell wall biosynthesis
MPVTTSNRSILILANTLFYPARRNGMSIRYFPVVRGLVSRGYCVDVLTINKYHEQYSDLDIEALSKYCRYVDVIEPVADQKSLHRLKRRIHNVAHLLAPFGKPYGLIDNQREHYLRQVEERLGSRDRYAAAIGVSDGGNNADLLLSLPEAIRPRRILCDFIDSVYLLKKRARVSGNRPVNWLGLLEESKIRRWEESICQQCPCFYISEKDAESVGHLASVIPNSIVVDGYAEASPVSLESPNIAFLGNMAYPPNARAGNWLVAVLFPRLKKVLPDLHCYIIGRNPGKELQRLCNDPAIHLTGEVDNIWDYIRAVDVFVFPLFSGAGLQNKVLEAMYACKPVVASPIANEGIGAEHGKEICIAEHVNDYISLIGSLIHDPGRVGEQAREYIIRNFCEDGVIDRYIELIETRIT